MKKQHYAIWIVVSSAVIIALSFAPYIVRENDLINPFALSIVMSYIIFCYRILSCLILSYLILSYLMLSQPILSAIISFFIILCILFILSHSEIIERATIVICLSTISFCNEHQYLVVATIFVNRYPNV